MRVSGRLDASGRGFELSCGGILDDCGGRRVRKCSRPQCARVQNRCREKDEEEEEEQQARRKGKGREEE